MSPKRILLVFGFVFWALSSQALAMDIQSFETSSGAKLWLVEDHSTPIVSVHFSIEAGVKHDPDGKEGLIGLMANMMGRGAVGYSETVFDNAFKDYSASIDFVASKDHLDGHFMSIKENLYDAAKLVNLAMTQPSFDQDVFEREKALFLKAIAQQEKQQGYIALKLAGQTLFPESSYAKYATLDSVASFVREDLVQAHEDFMKMNNLHIAISGDITLKEAKKLANVLFADLSKAANAKSQESKVEIAGEGRVVTSQLKIPQTKIEIYMQAIGPHDPDWFAQNIFTEIFGGGRLSSLLNMEIREKRGLSYGIFSYSQNYDFLDTYVITGETKNETAAEVAKIMMQVSQDVIDKGFSQGQLDHAKKYLKGRFPVRFQSNKVVSGYLLTNMREGISIERLNNYNENVDKVTLDQLNAFAKKLLDPSKMLLVAVGQPEGINNNDKLSDFMSK